MRDSAIQRLRKWEQGKNAPPEKVQIYPTNICNLNCIFCAQQREDYGYDSELSAQQWQEVTKNICEIGTERILISGGGEPFCRPKATLNIMNEAKKNDIKGRIITNGTLIDKTIAKKIIDLGWETVVFSIDSPKAKIQDHLRGRKGAFSRSIENIKLLNSLKDEKKPNIEVNYILMNENYKKIPEMLQLCNKLKVSYINFEPITINNKVDKELKITGKERKLLINQVIPSAEKLTDQLRVSSNLQSLKEIKTQKAGDMKDEIKNYSRETNKLSDSPCFEPWLWPKIEANGDVWPCSTVPMKENVQEKNFAEIWYGEQFRKFRSKIKKGELPEDCNNCVTTHLKTNRDLRNKIRGKRDL